MFKISLPKNLFLWMLLAFMLTAFTLPETKKKDSPKTEKDPVSAQTFSGLQFRSIGPAFTSGRVNDFAVNPANPSEYYVGVAAGGVWKTVNNGTTFSPIFDRYGSYSIGSVVMDPNSSSTIWVGTGEFNSQRAIGYGDGVYKSIDGGRSFKNMGLKKSEHIGRILIDPRNSDVVYVAAQGPLWGPGGDRGLYKTTDGGESWEKVLDISENTGVTDILMDPRNPDIIYAASYQRRRHVWTLINGGPETSVYKSTDAGKSFRKITKGLPGVDLGRIGLAISPVNPDYIFAIVEAAEGQDGFFRSTNKGESWEKMSNHVSGSPQYYNRIYCDLWNVDKLYSMETRSMYTLDGGKTWEALGGNGKHVDDHAFWMDPRDPQHYLIGCDGGIYESFDASKTWIFKPNLSVTQFYRVATDNDYPFYNIYGGTQDNNSLGGPSRVFRSGGALNSDWFTTNGGDGFFSRVDPTNPDIVYAESQFGGLVRYDRKSKESVGIQPQPPAGESYRWNWNAPIIISKFDHKTLYFAANKLFKSSNYGNKWEVISPDLSRQLDRNKLKVMGVVQNIDAVAKSKSTSVYGNIVALTESPVQQGLLYVGTDDGLIQVTEDDGKNWRKIESFPGIPELTYVSCLLADKHDANVVYACFDGRKNADFKPYILKSTDKGQSWSSISSDLPENGTVHTIQQDYLMPELLFAGTEFSFYISRDGGQKWLEFNSGLPTIAIRDIAIQERENDLVLASFGRGFFILDNYAPLREFDPGILDQEGFIFPIKKSLLYEQEGMKYGQGSTVFTAPNPPYGASFTYYVKDQVKTLEQKRKSEQAKARKDGTDPPYPNYDEIRAEQEEENPFLQFTIKNDKGQIVRNIKTRQSTGIKRITWDFSQEVPSSPNLRGSANNMGTNPAPATALPGVYTVELSRNVGGVITPLAGPVKFEVSLLNHFTLPAKDRGAVIAFIEKATQLNNAVGASSSKLSEIAEQIQYGKQLGYNMGADAQLMKELKSMETEAKDLDILFNGNPIISNLFDEQPPGIRQRAGRLRWISANQDVPETSMEQYDIVVQAMNEVVPRIEKLSSRLSAIKQKFDQLNYPWTPGRDIPDWK